MSVLDQPFFRDEAAAYAKLESILWPHGPVCPKCGVIGEAYELKGKRSRIGLRRCGACKKDFTVKVGTVFESSHIELHKWFQAAYLMASSKKGFSAHQLHRTLDITYKSAWFMAHRLREAMRVLHPTPIGGEGKVIEMDETFVGGKERNKHKSKRDKKNIGGVGKETVFSLVERGGGVRSHHLRDVSAKTLRPILKNQLEDAAKTHLMTDGEGQFRKFSHMFASHEAVNHGIGEYVRGNAHTNTIEGYFSILKRGIAGTYHHVSQQHLKRYLGEFDFGYNERSALGVGDTERMIRALAGIRGKRLTYRDSSWLRA